jgi:hypothetical protein
MRLDVTGFLLFAMSIARPATPLSTDQLRERSIYQVFTDRFARSDDQVTYCNVGERDYCGGTWKGIERKLGYIQGMGFDTSESRRSGHYLSFRRAGRNGVVMRVPLHDNGIPL